MDSSYLFDTINLGQCIVHIRSVRVLIIIYNNIFLLNHSRRVVVSYKQKYVHEVLVNCLSKLAQEKVWLGELTVPP